MKKILFLIALGLICSLTYGQKLSQIKDVSATATEVNVLDGILTTTGELNKLVGVTKNIKDDSDSIKTALQSKVNNADIVDDSWYSDAEVRAYVRSTIDSLVTGTFTKGDSIYKMTYVARIPTEPTTLDDNVAALWNLNETSAGDVVDSYGINSGTNSGATINQTGKVGQAYDFEFSEGDKITIADNNSLSFVNSAFSISAWVNPESFSTYHTILSKHTEYWFCVNSAGKVVFRIYSSSGVYSEYIGGLSQSSLTTGVWSNVVVTYNGGNALGSIKIYINGTEVICDDQGGGTIPSTANTANEATISYEQNNGGMYFDGLLDQIVIHSRILTSGEVTELYNSGNGKSF